MLTIKRITIYSLIFMLTMTGLYAYSAISPYNLINIKLTSEEKKVAAFYYGWYSNDTDYSQTLPYEIQDDAIIRHWNDATHQIPVNAVSTNTPILGWYDSSDPEVIESHLRDAEWCGIDSFICSYWGATSHELTQFKNMINVAKAINSNLTFTLYFETDLGNLRKKTDDEAIPLLQSELESIYELFIDPNYADYIWTTDEKPVLFAYVVQQLNSTVWDAVISALDEKDYKFYLVGDRPGNDFAYNQFFDAAHQYDVYAPTYSNNYFGDFLSIKKNCKSFNQLFIAGVSPGYNDTVVRDGHPALLRFNGETYKSSWNSALALNPDWITITSWNEWHEGTDIEPSIEYGNLALEQTKTYIEEFKDGVYVELDPKVDYIGIIWVGLVAIAVSWIVFGILRLIPKKNDLKIPIWVIRIIGVFFWLISIGALVYFTFAEIFEAHLFSISATPWFFLTSAAVLFNEIGNRLLQHEPVSK